MHDFPKGKWHIQEAQGSYFICAEGKNIATVEDEHVARFIAAAPDMYDILYILDNSFDDYEFDNDAPLQARIWKLLRRIDGKEEKKAGEV